MRAVSEWRIALASALLTLVACTAVARAQQTDAQRMALLKAELPPIIQQGEVAVVAAACGLRPAFYTGMSIGQQDGAAQAVIVNLWGVDPMSVTAGPAYRAMQWAYHTIDVLDGNAAHPTPEDCGRLATDPAALGEADRFVDWPPQ